VNCALIGGEMAEMPGFYQQKDYDVAGCIVGLVERNRIINGSQIDKGDVLIGLPSNGLHTNGYSLVRKILLEKENLKMDSYLDDLGCTLVEELLRVHRCYFNTIHSLLDQVSIQGMSHITGGGVEGNTKRILPGGRRLVIDWESWERPPIFGLIQSLGQVPEEDMRCTFNLGIGLIIIVHPDEEENVITLLKKEGCSPIRVGRIE
jgi:phosphoribosylformylglycinamidine cyclo-ligase